MPPPGDGLLPVVPSPTSISDPPLSADTVRKCGRLWRPDDPPVMALSPQHLNLTAVSLPEKRSLDIDAQSELSAVLPSASALHFDAASSADAALSSYASAMGAPKPKKRRNWAPIAVVPMVKISLPTDVKPDMLLELKLHYQTMCSWESQIFMVSTLLSLVKSVLRPHADLKKIAALGRRLSKTRKRFLNAQRAVFDVQNERGVPPALPLTPSNMGSSSKPMQQSPASSQQYLEISEGSPKPCVAETNSPAALKLPPLPKKCIPSEIHGKPPMHRPRAVRPVAPRVPIQHQMQPQISAPADHSSVPSGNLPAISQCMATEQQQQQQHELASLSMAQSAISQPAVAQPAVAQETLLVPRPKPNQPDPSAPIDTREISVGYRHPSSGSQSANEPSTEIVGSPIEQQQWLTGTGTLDHEPVLSKMEPTTAELPSPYPTHDFSPVTPGNTNRRVIGVPTDAFAQAPGMGVPARQAVPTSPWESTSYSSSVTHMNSQAPDAPYNNILSRFLAPPPSNLQFTPSTTVNPLTNHMNPIPGAMNNAPVTPVSFSPANISAPNQMGVFDPGHSLLGRVGTNPSSVLNQSRDLLSLTLDKTDLTTWDPPKDSFGSTGSWTRPKDPPPVPRSSFSDNPSPVPDAANDMAPPSLPPPTMPPSNLSHIGLSSSGLTASGVATPGLAPLSIMQSTVPVGGITPTNYSPNGIVPNGMMPNNMVSNGLGPNNMSPGNLPAFPFEGGTDPSAGGPSAYIDHRMGFYPTDNALRMQHLGANDSAHDLFGGSVNQSGFFGAGSAPLPTTTQGRGGRAGDREVAVPDATSLLGPWQQAA